MDLDIKSQHAYKSINSISQLEDNWNSYNGKKISVEVIHRARKILDYLVSLNNRLLLPEVFPTARSSIQFEYDLANNNHIDLEIFSDKILIYHSTVDYSKRPLTGISECYELDYDVKLIQEKLLKFINSESKNKLE